MEAPGAEAPRSNAVGARIEWPRSGEGVSPSPLGRGRPLPIIFFQFLSSKRRVLVHSGTGKLYPGVSMFWPAAIQGIAPSPVDPPPRHFTVCVII